LTDAEQKFAETEKEFQKADSKTSKLQEEFEERKKAQATAQKAHENAQEDLRVAQITAEDSSRRYKEKVETVKKAAEACYVDAPAAPTASPPSP
jgi:septation ring formation regulator EzrA